MKPKIVHQEVMELSFKAKEAIAAGDFLSANDFYVKAAEKEAALARFYFDKPEMEPTRSTIVRSAVFLCLKAGLIDQAQKLIFWGLLHVEDTHIIEELEEALGLTVALKNTNYESMTYNVEYFNVLRMRSINYTMEPVHQNFRNIVSLEMLRDFTTEYLRSLKAYAKASFARMDSLTKEFKDKLEEIPDQIEQLVNPLITTTGIGSFLFGIANDFVPQGEDKELVKFKADILINYHERIFTNPLSDSDIESLKSEYKEDEINQIFKPITKIKSSSSPYKVAYYDINTFRKKDIAPIAKLQRKKLLPLHPPTAEDIGVLESSIIHARQLNDGKKKRNVIQREQLKTYKIEFKTTQIEPKDIRPLPLNESIVIDIDFDNSKGFTFSLEELAVTHTDTDYNLGYQVFSRKLYDRVIEVIKKHQETGTDSQEWNEIIRLINNPQSLV